MHSCGGGPAANAAVAIARLGGKAAFGGYLGNDAFGNSHLSEFEAEGVITDWIERGSTPTPIAAVIIKPSGERTIIDHCDSATRLTAIDAIFENHTPKVVLIDGHQPLASLDIVNEARRRGIPTILDAGSLHDGTELLYNKVDYLITSEKFARQFSKEELPTHALESLSGAATHIAVTWGAEGVYWSDERGQITHTPAFNIEAIDTTGAGDAFHGAFALAIARKTQLKVAYRYASAVGALTCMTCGARNAFPQSEVVEKLLAK